MSYLLNNHSRRHAVLTVLVVWLFALGSNFANACLLQDRSMVAYEESFSGRVSVGTLLALPDQIIAADSDHHGSTDGDNDTCLKHFDDGSNAIVKMQSSVDPTFATMAPSVAFKWESKLAASSAVDPLRAMPTFGLDLPLRTRFSRLAL